MSGSSRSRTSAPGGPDYAGEQDNDPVNPTDCATASEAGTELRAAELQVFSANVPLGAVSRRRPRAAGVATGAARLGRSVEVARERQGDRRERDQRHAVDVRRLVQAELRCTAAPAATAGRLKAR